MLDVFSREVVGWSMATYLRTEPLLAALQMAIGQPGANGVIHHSDQGCYMSISSSGNAAT